MSSEQIEHCRRRVREEERLGASATSAEVAERHQQMAMLYKVQLSVLESRVGTTSRLPRHSPDRRALAR